MHQQSEIEGWGLAKYLVSGQVMFAALLWIPFALVITGITFAIDRFGDVDMSVWEGATQVIRWYALGISIYVISPHFPLYVASGGTRAGFVRQYAAFAVAFGAGLAALVTVGFGAETLLYRWQGWSQGVNGAVLYDSATQYLGVFINLWLVVTGWMAVVGFVAATFYRKDVILSTLSIPAGLVLLSGVELAARGNVLGFLPLMSDSDTVYATSGLVAALAATVIGLVAMRWATRHVPIGSVSQ